MAIKKDLQVISPEKAMYRAIGAGAAFPFKFSSSGRVKSVEVSQGVSKINQSIHLILSTRRGERFMLPEFGCFAGETEILTLTGNRVRISDLVDSKIYVFGTTFKEASRFGPATNTLVTSSTDGAIFRGIKKVVTVTLSSGVSIRCTPDHLFLLEDGVTYKKASQLTATDRLAWVDTSMPDLGMRIQAWKKVRSAKTALCNMPMTRGLLWCVSVEDKGEEVEVFDILNSRTYNYALGCGAVVHNSNLPRLVFEPNDEILEDQLVFETEEALARWERRIDVVGVQTINPYYITVTELQDTQANKGALDHLKDSNSIGIYIQYVIKRTNVVGSYVYPFRKHPMPMEQTVTQGGVRGVESLYGQGLYGPQGGF